MKIAVIIERAEIALGGAERSIFELTAELSSLGLQVVLLAAKGKIGSRNVHVLCAANPGKRTRLQVFGKAIKKHLAANHYDIIHSVMPFPFADIYQPRGGGCAESIIRNAASYDNTLGSMYKRATAFANLRRAGLLRAEKDLCNNSTGPTIAALSEYVKQQFKNHYKLNDERIVVIPNGIKIGKIIDTSRAERLHKQILGRLQLNGSSNPAFFLFVANNFRLKGLRVLIRAMQLVGTTARPRPAYLIVAGRDKSHKYRRLAKNLGITDRIVFLGHVRHIQNALAIADAAVLPTYYDPCSRFTLEALAALKPVITTRFNGATDLFVNNRHGRIIQNPQDVSALADAIGHFTDAENVQKASQAIAEDNLREKISITRHAEQLVAVYELILNKKGQK